MDVTSSESGIRAEADRCVKCGLCLPHCPTWQVHRREGDSPRGRIELIAALAGGQMESSPALQARLDGCLLCRACESVCPARVPFGHLMDRAREHWPVQGVWWSRLFCSGTGRILLRFGFWLAAASGLARVGGPLLGLLPDFVVLRRKRVLDAEGPLVGLFTGCVSDVVDRVTLNDAASLLEYCGARVAWVEGSGCCGALDRHQGRAASADAHVRGNAERINLSAFDRLVSIATGCSTELMDYPRLLDGAEATEWADKHWEVMAYLASRQEKLSFRPLQKTVLLHHPCSARNMLRDTDSATRLLQRIPQLNVVESRHSQCCGAAGVAMFRTPQTARALAGDIVEEVSRREAEILVTANIGCALHLRGAFRAAGLDVAVKHPVNLLREQLKDQTCVE
ncbi:MAG: (Fe-S)-binding protein [Gammaproteobacteria bacterium]|nr:(Fe-S)-binding protein [Gammaproteobacteria bacterium]